MDFTHPLVELYKDFVSSGVSVRLNLWSSGKEQFFSFSKTKGSRSPTTKRNQRRRQKWKEKQETLKNLQLKKCSLKVDYKNLRMQRWHRGLMLVPLSLEPGLQFPLNLELLVCFLVSGTGSLDSGTSYISSSKSKFLKAGFSSTVLRILFSQVLYTDKSKSCLWIKNLIRRFHYIQLLLCMFLSNWNLMFKFWRNSIL